MQTVREQLVDALEFERQISRANDPEAYPQFVEMRDNALDRHRAEPEEPCRHDRHRAKEDERTHARAEAEREPAGRGTA